MKVDFREIPLTRGQSTIVDECDYDWLVQWKWRLLNPGYAARADYSTGRHVAILMHRIIARCPSGLVVDHINRNPLDNRRCNLRICDRRQNIANAPARKHNIAGVKGVSPMPSGRWIARIRENKKSVSLGVFDSLREAELAYAKAARRLYGDFAFSTEVIEIHA